MAHRHLCMACGEIIEEGDSDCESDSDHDYELCDRCATEVGAIIAAKAAAVVDN